MKRIAPFTIFVAASLFGLAVRGDDSSHEPDDRDIALKAAKDAVAHVKGKLSADEPALPSQQAECLRLAALLAELGGLDKDAKHLRDEAEMDHPPLSVMEVLARRQAQLDALQGKSPRLTNDPHRGQIMVEVKMIEASPAAVKALLGHSDKVPYVTDSGRDLLKQLDDLRTRGVVKILAEPTLITVSGRPAFCQSGGELPFVQNQNVEFKRYGTQVNLVPTALGNDKLHLDFKFRVSFVDPTLSVTTGGVTSPGLIVRECDTAVEFGSGETFVICGLTQNRDPVRRPIPRTMRPRRKPQPMRRRGGSSCLSCCVPRSSKIPTRLNALRAHRAGNYGSDFSSGPTQRRRRNKRQSGFHRTTMPQDSRRPQSVAIANSSSVVAGTSSEAFGAERKAASRNVPPRLAQLPVYDTLPEEFPATLGQLGEAASNLGKSSSSFHISPAGPWP